MSQEARLPVGKDQAVVLAMLELKRGTKGPAVAVIGDWLVRRAKRTWPRWAGLGFFKATNVPWRFSIVSYHHPAQLCWSWSWRLSFSRRDTRWCAPTKWFRPFRFGSASFKIPWLFEITYSRQPYDWMLSSRAEYRLRAFALGELAQSNTLGQTA